MNAHRELAKPVTVMGVVMPARIVEPIAATHVVPVVRMPHLPAKHVPVGPIVTDVPVKSLVPQRVHTGIVITLATAHIQHKTMVVVPAVTVVAIKHASRKYIHTA